MGHLRVRNMYKSRKWKEVIRLLESGADVAEIAARSLLAARAGFTAAASDPGLIYAFWLLTQLPLAAREGFFPEALRRLNVLVSNEPTLMEIVGAFSDAVDTHTRRSNDRSDFSEMALLSATESLTALVGDKTASFLEPESRDVQQAIAGFSKGAAFSQLGRSFMSRLTRRYLSYFLSTELSNHVGKDHRFANLSEHSAFTEALNRHCYQASRIVEEFAGGWYAKNVYEGEITTEKVQGFLHVAMKKLVKELERGEAVG